MLMLMQGNQLRIIVLINISNLLFCLLRNIRSLNFYRKKKKKNEPHIVPNLCQIVGLAIKARNLWLNDPKTKYEILVGYIRLILLIVISFK